MLRHSKSLLQCCQLACNWRHYIPLSLDLPNSWIETGAPTYKHKALYGPPSILRWHPSYSGGRIILNNTFSSHNVDLAMANTDASDAANKRLNQYMFISAAAYDTLLTLSEEIEFVWMRRIRISPALYLMGRYGILLGLIFGFAWSKGISPISTCSGLGYTMSIFATFGAIGIDGVIILTLGHTWRLYHKDIRRQMSLIGLLIYQGIIRFSIIFIWVIIIIVTSQTLENTLNSVALPLEEATSVILICRFFLQLSSRGTLQRPQSQSLSRWTSTFHTFHHVADRIGVSIIEDMGDHTDDMHCPSPSSILENQPFHKNM
ncbi:hypothetical protein M422DRAFT_273221 [Sphaerobolus stellatus SS14]|uniref:DUF6533 domain-containing protein n=1 Tax=Sphaerobolus stellatus (strain SS14) TaxID=990650 RepID=A0A0C9UK41_SPHS4|nr:hypothetical protein M422DRAFT_275653 [Sphaerobolus stellatus SS14]KIJ25766.1 hypothetical protein M422DRAFT_273221 [Sphaerobolus stellatus SS14]